jgi:hypothetical protein
MKNGAKNQIVAPNFLNIAIVAKNDEKIAIKKCHVKSLLLYGYNSKIKKVFKYYKKKKMLNAYKSKM